AEHHGLPHQRLTRDEVEERFPQHRLRPGEEGVYEEGGGVLLPEAATRAAVRLAKAFGARVLTGTEVTHIVPDSDRPCVWTGHTRIRARRVVVTAGSWIPRSLPWPFDQVLRLERRFRGWFRTTDPSSRHPHVPVFARNQADRTLWYRFPSLDGRTVKFGVHAEPLGTRRPGTTWGELVVSRVGP